MSADSLIRAYESPELSELMINADQTVYAERTGGKLERLSDAIDGEALTAFLTKLVGEAWRLDPKQPYADLSGRDGSRIHIMAPPLVQGGLSVTVRKRPKHRPDLTELVKLGTMSQACAEFLNFAAFYGKNVLVTGGTSSGKTTLLNALGARCSQEDRILVLEDTAELTLPQPHVVYMKTRMRDRDGQPDVTLHDLVLNALRMRPDRILVGETRGKEAADMLNAMNVGHDGIFTTLHANSSRESLQRLEVLVLLSGMTLPLRALRQNIVTAIDVVVVMSRFQDGSRRVIQVTEATGMEEDMITLADLFKAELSHAKGSLSYRLVPTGVVPKFYDSLRSQGVDCPTEFFRR